MNYPPLGHAWMRFTHPAHGQMAAVAVGLLVLLPWGTLRLARAVGFLPHAQRFAVGSVLVLAAVSGKMHWVLSGLHYTSTFFGSWPRMLATMLGLFCAAWAARCRRPATCGAVAGAGDPLQRHGRPRRGRRVRGPAGHQRRLLPPGGALGRDRGCGGRGRVSLVDGAVPCRMGTRW